MEIIEISINEREDMSKAKVKAKISNRNLRSDLLERERIVFGFVFAIVAFFAATLIAVVTVLGVSSQKTPGDSVKIVTPLNVDALATSEVKSESAINVTDYEAVLNTNWYFNTEDNTYASNAYVENSRYNKCRVRFTVALTESPDEILYRSKDLKVGDKVRGVKLDKKLADGVYDATVTYRILDDNGNETGNVKTGITLYIGEAADAKSE